MFVSAGVRIRVGGVAEEVRGGACSYVVAQYPRPGLSFPVKRFTSFFIIIFLFACALVMMLALLLYTFHSCQHDKY